MSYESSDHFYSNHNTRSQQMMPSNSMAGSHFYNRPPSQSPMTNHQHQLYASPSSSSHQTFPSYDAYETQSRGYYPSYSSGYEHQQRPMGINYGDNHAESLSYPPKDSGLSSSINELNAMIPLNDHQNSNAIMPMTQTFQRNVGYNNSSMIPLSRQQPQGDLYGNNSASQYSFGNPAMMNSRFPTPNRSSYQNGMIPNKVQSYPQQQVRYPSYSNAPSSQSTWPPVISAGSTESESNYTRSQTYMSSSSSTNENRSQDDDNNSIKTKPNIPESPSCTSISSNIPDDIDSSNSSFSDSPSITNEKSTKKTKNSQTTSVDVFNKLREMGNEQERNLFVDRLQKLWEETHTVCRKLPTLSRQTIDLYRLYSLIREQNGFEQFSKIAKNRHWRDIALKLNIPNCSTAAFNIKQKYINLKLFHYECKHDRSGIDPEPILADITKPKEKRFNKNNDEKLGKSFTESSSSSSIKQTENDSHPSNLNMTPLIPSINTQSQQVPTPINYLPQRSEEPPKLQSRPMAVSFPSNSIEATTISAKNKRKKLTAKDIPPIDPMKLLMSLRGGLLAETTWALDTINIMLNDDQTHTFFRLKQMPGLLQAIIDIYTKCLTQLFDEFKIDNESNSKEELENEEKQDSVIYRIESNYLNKYQRKSIKQQDVTYEHVYDNQGKIKDTPDYVLNLQNLDDLCYIQTHFDPLHIDDNYYENLYYGHHSDDTLSSDEHDQVPIKSSRKRIKTCEIEISNNNNNNNDNEEFLQRYQRTFQPEEHSFNNINIDSHTNSNNQQENALSIFTRYSFGYDQICSRCICASSILRNLSFISGNDIELVKYKTLIHVLARVLLLRHDINYNNENILLSDKQMKESLNDQTINNCQLKNEDQNASPSFSWSECVINIRENTLVTLANISGVLIFDTFDSDLINQLIDGLLHWSTCYSDEAIDPLQSSYLSAQRLSIEILTKLSVHDMNMDFILATPPFHRIISLLHTLTNWLNVDDMNNNNLTNLTRSQTYIQREFAIVLLNALIRCDSNIANIIAHVPYAISLIINFLEDYEMKTNELNTRYGSDYLLRLTNTPQAEQILFTTNDMLKRAATCLLSIVNYTENIKIMKKFEDRILNLSMSNVVDRNIGRILTDILHYCSLYNS
ncbi:unnamed protein product [Adineta steineri]|uniref:ARID domain-containing protein n=1 Tax=Adineta steineri TaxID=433720 RepID=A0A819MJQ5_9BILA|nr:unnamed protein product [Adineta steineri]CAF1115779.1 unnamed protein product [Adineta steineri]CAF1305483.1 unnamed protein product [Adineta steineri]CAF3981360.1 unnamed protein product [Adineta steineri]